MKTMNEKVKMTRKDLTGKPVIKVGYCGAYNLLRGLQPVGYMSGVYGWNCDVYDVSGAFIVTGYRFYGIRGTYADPAALDIFESTAAFLWDCWKNNTYVTYREISERIETSIQIFVRYTLNKEG